MTCPCEGLAALRSGKQLSRAKVASCDPLTFHKTLLRAERGDDQAVLALSQCSLVSVPEEDANRAMMQMAFYEVRTGKALKRHGGLDKKTMRDAKRVIRKEVKW